MRNIFMPALLVILISGLPACKKADKQIEEKPLENVIPGQEQLQQAKGLEKKMQQDAEERRKVIEIQSK